MSKQPTYEAKEILNLCTSCPVDHVSFAILVNLIEEEIELYDEYDIPILMQASMIIFSRSLLKSSMRFL